MASKKGPCTFFPFGKCTKGDNCPFSHDPREMPLCSFYQKGNCREGPNCRFRHEPAVLPQVVSPPIKVVLPPPIEEICRYHLRGTCRYGDHCKFAHPPIEPTDELTEDDIKKLERDVDALTEIATSENSYLDVESRCIEYWTGECQKGTECDKDHTIPFPYSESVDAVSGRKMFRRELFIPSGCYSESSPSLHNLIVCPTQCDEDDCDFWHLRVWEGYDD